MPSTKVKPSERRRCPQACGCCKRRKERCDGRQPCSRCIARGVQYECFFSRPLEPVETPAPSTAAASASSTASAPPAALGASGAAGTVSAPPPASSPLSPASATAPNGTTTSAAPAGSTATATSAVTAASAAPVGSAASGPSAGKSASPGNNGTARAPSSSSGAGSVRRDRSFDFDGPGAHAHTRTAAPPETHRRKRRRSNTFGSSSAAAPVPHLSRLIQGGHGSLFYIGDSANLCFLQIIRRLVREALGSCTFTDDPLQHVIVEAAPNARGNWVANAIHGPPDIPPFEESLELLNWFLRGTNGVLGMYDQTELRENLQWWWQQQQPSRDGTDASPDSCRDSCRESCRDVAATATADAAAQEAIFFLIFAIGAQTSPGDHDEIAERYFNYGRYLAVCGATVEPSISTIQAYILLTMYLLGASRRNAAFMYLGIAVRAAYALGIHRSDVNAAFDPVEYAPRERLWKVLRILDIFMSTSLGRPPSTAETRDTKAEKNYSASIDLCAIFEAILTQVYSTRTVSTATIEKISEQHRLWTTRFASGLAADGICTDELIDFNNDGERVPNIGLYHLKEAYYWTIMLLSRPFLIENVSRHITRTRAQAATQAAAGSGVHTPALTGPNSPSDDILAYACVDSAIRTISLLRGLLSAPKVPKRLPFIVNSAFVSALVLGFAHFGDLDRIFPIAKTLAIAQKVLGLFGQHDSVAKRYTAIIGDLLSACELYVESRARGKMERHSALIGGLFGTVDEAKGGAMVAAVVAAAATVAGTNGTALPNGNSQAAQQEAPNQPDRVDVPGTTTPPTTSAASSSASTTSPVQQHQPPLQNHVGASQKLSHPPDLLGFGTQTTQGEDVTSATSCADPLQITTPLHPPNQQQQQQQQQQQHSITPSQPSTLMHQRNPYAGLDLTPSSADENDDFLGVGPGAGGDNVLLQNHASAFGMDDASQNLLPHMPGLPDMIMSLSPRMLSFDSFDKNLQLFPTMDATGLF